MKNVKKSLGVMLACVTSALCAQQQTPLANPSDTLAAYQKTRVKEYGIGFTGLNSYSLQYRWGTAKLLYRINANLGLSGLTNNNITTDTYYQNGGGNSSSFNQTQTKTPFTITTGVGFSVLSLKQINTKFGLMIGGIAGLTYSNTAGQNMQTNSNSYGGVIQSTTTKTSAQTFQPYIGCVLGAYYKINPSFIIYAEISPNIFYASTKSTSSIYQDSPYTLNYKESDSKTTFSNLGLSGLTNSSAMITLVYRITK